MLRREGMVMPARRVRKRAPRRAQRTKPARAAQQKIRACEEPVVAVLSPRRAGE